MRYLWIATVVLGMFAAVRAQAPAAAGSNVPAFGGIAVGSPGLGPGFSPYLNLSRGGNSAAANLYGIVRPQLSMQSSLRTLEQNAAAGASQSADDGTLGAVVAPRVRFLNTGGYFMNIFGGTSNSATLSRPQSGPLGGSAGLGGSFGSSGANGGRR